MIIFGMGMMFFAVLLPTLCILISYIASLLSSYIWPGALHPIEMWITKNGDQIMKIYAGIWLLCVVCLWIILVLQARIDKESRVHDSDLKRFEIVIFILIFLGTIGDIGHVTIQVGLTIFEIAEWICIFFYCLYFLFALCVWVKVPFRQYLIFAILVAFTVLMGYWL